MKMNKLDNRNRVLYLLLIFMLFVLSCSNSENAEIPDSTSNNEKLKSSTKSENAEIPDPTPSNEKLKSSTDEVASDSFPAVNNMVYANTLESIINATVFLKLKDSSASGFVIKYNEQVLIVTNAHIFNQKQVKGSVVETIFYSGTGQEIIAKATVLGASTIHDLAILNPHQIPSNIKAIEFAPPDSIKIGSKASIIGFPFGNALRTQTYPTATLNLSSVSSLRYNDFRELLLIQFSSDLNPGNSGGPVVDEAGRLIGILNSGLSSLGISFAIPVDKLRNFLEGGVSQLSAFKKDYTLSFKFQINNFQENIESVQLVYGEFDPKDKVINNTIDETAKVIPSAGDEFYSIGVPLEILADDTGYFSLLIKYKDSEMRYTNFFYLDEEYNFKTEFRNNHSVSTTSLNNNTDSQDAIVNQGIQVAKQQISKLPPFGSSNINIDDKFVLNVESLYVDLPFPVKSWRLGSKHENVFIIFQNHTFGFYNIKTEKLILLNFHLDGRIIGHGVDSFIALGESDIVFLYPERSVRHTISYPGIPLSVQGSSLNHDRVFFVTQNPKEEYEIYLYQHSARKSFLVHSFNHCFETYPVNVFLDYLSVSPNGKNILINCSKLQRWLLSVGNSIDDIQRSSDYSQYISFLANSDPYATFVAENDKNFFDVSPEHDHQYDFVFNIASVDSDFMIQTKEKPYTSNVSEGKYSLKLLLNGSSSKVPFSKDLLSKLLIDSASFLNLQPIYSSESKMLIATNFGVPSFYILKVDHDKIAKDQIEENQFFEFTNLYSDFTPEIPNQVIELGFYTNMKNHRVSILNKPEGIKLKRGNRLFIDHTVLQEDTNVTFHITGENGFKKIQNLKYPFVRSK